jgi:hypothetical protein
MTAPTHYNGKPIPPGTWLTLSAEEARKLSDLPPSGLSPHDTVPVATYNRMVRKRDEAVRERDEVRQMLADAPHGWACDLGVPPALDRTPDDAKCSCWKAGL